MPRPDLPTGTVTFLFTDIEGSTRLLHELGAEAYADALAEHRRQLRAALVAGGGIEVDTQGDAFFFAFPTAAGALATARKAQAALAPGRIRVRMGIHTGTPVLAAEGYVGPDVHRAARIAAAGHGGQVLISAATAGLVDRSELVDLGEHRLKDLSTPERIYQLGAGEFPPLKTLYQTNLPVPTTSFLGRQRELADVTNLLARAEVRVVTLTGPGGTGKTRLALQAAGASAELFPAGVWWVPLTPLRDPGLVLATAAGVLGASGDLADHIGDRQLLLLFDNFEQVVAAAIDVGRLLARCPNLKALVTSRELLQLAGEHVYPVPPLEPGDGERLFVTRASAARPDFHADAAVAELCRRLDNLPLAIELAAARVRMLSPEQLLQRLAQRLDLLKGGRGVDDRQQTLRATIEWSHDLLSNEEQVLFRRLAVFSGGWTLEAAEQVCNADIDLLQSLVDKSLGRVRGERFSMLETIREFAAEALGASGEGNELRQRHADFFLTFAKEAEPHVLLDDIVWLDRLEADQHNLRAALDFFDVSGAHESSLQMAAALWRFWYLKSHNAEGLVRLSAAIEHAGMATLDLATAHRGASVMALNVGDSMTGLSFAERALELDRSLGYEWGVAYSLLMIGNCTAEGSDEPSSYRLAIERLRESADLFEKLGDEHYGLIATFNQGWILEELGEQEAGRNVQRRVLEAARQSGREGLEASALAELGINLGLGGNLTEGIAMLEESIRIDHARGTFASVEYNMARLGALRARAGDYVVAARLIGGAARLREQLSVRQLSWHAARDVEARALIAEQIGPAALEQELAAGRSLPLEELVALALLDSQANDATGEGNSKS
jgi:predicted ATPase